MALVLDVDIGSRLAVETTPAHVDNESSLFSRLAYKIRPKERATGMAN